ncbi:MAG: hypothetical protein JSV36_06570 [Anaerolineae bacterium]|nr:MAG: hypothetical protein JSV36_06570 [Anaerolineae bacterium]
MSKRTARIEDIGARNVLNSRGDFCLEVEISLDDGTQARESSPSGTTTGKYDAKSLSTAGALRLLPVLRRELIGVPVREQQVIDQRITKCLSNGRGRIFASNLSTATSMAICRAAAISFCVPLYRHLAELFETTPSIPRLIVNVLNGGAHSGNELPITEFMLVTGDCTAREALAGAVSVYHALRDIIKTRYGSSSIHVGLEGGFAPALSDPKQAIELLIYAIDASNRQGSVLIGLDIAASSLFDPQREQFRYGGEYLSTEDLIAHYEEMVEEYDRIIYLEDPLSEDQAPDWTRLRQKLPERIIAGDDLTSTSSKRLSDVIALGAINAIVLKINQCGTVSALVDCLHLARTASLVTVMSQRSCETDSDFLSHLTVGLGADYLKAGACARERIIKYNSLLRIAESFQQEAQLSILTSARQSA